LAHLAHVVEEHFRSKRMPSLLRFVLASFIHIYMHNFLELLQRYDTNGFYLKKFMDEVRSNMI